MKKLLLSIVLYFAALAAFGQATAGRDFWVAFGVSNNNGGIEYHVRIVASVNTNVTLNFTNNASLNRTIQVAAGAIQTIDLTQAERVAINNTTSATTSKSLHITSDNDISVCIALLGTDGTSDAATGIFPVSLFGNDYFHISYTIENGDGYRDGYLIIATDNNTQIYENGTLVTTLNQGQVFSKYNNADMTSRHITSSKPIAYFVAVEGVSIPTGVTWRDHIIEQLLPVNLWKTEFLVPVTNMGTNRVRIVASQNGTLVSQTGGTVVSGSLNLNAGEFVELQITQSNSGCYISSNKPIEVCSYILGCTYFSSADCNGDPAFSIIPSVDYLVNSCILAPFKSNIQHSWQISNLFAQIVTPTATRNSTTVSVNGAAPTALSGGSWTNNAASGFSYYNMPLASNNTAKYKFDNSNGLIVYGYGIEFAAAYYYLASTIEEICVSVFDTISVTVCRNSIYNFN
ncbi:MAG: IgGFc-binding protein, partial [Paludibacter sp.]|nr:IgGFc-binding protein [Paludibacter sp.]